ncbi:MAG: hypothetical protein IKH28_10275 [Lachnospiraceae bacterium]|nr:hypothetical protein [Lachnospiraceae bacterium]
MAEQFFQKALSRFAIEFAAGNAIRALADKGLTVSEIHDELTYPVPQKTIGEMVWAHYLDTCVIFLEDPGTTGEKVVASYEQVQDAYGKISFRQIKKTIPVTGEYVPCDFGKWLYRDREGFLSRIQVLDFGDRDYILGLPWPLQTVYHKRDARMARIMQGLKGASL